MLKRNKKLLILTTIITLIPILVGLLLWNRLPDQIPTHWNIDGEIDGWSSKAFAVFVLPLICLAIHWFCVIASAADSKSSEYHPKMLRLVLWICPVIAVLMCSMVYAAALGYEPSIEIIMPLLVGLMFIIFGNYLPKCKRSYTMGIKLPWTLDNEENWNATHRFGGKVWVCGGIVTIASALFGNFWTLLVILALMVILPTLYSYLYYRKHKKGTA